MPDADFSKLKIQMSTIFNGAAGFAALQAKDYPKAASIMRKLPSRMERTCQTFINTLSRSLPVRRRAARLLVRCKGREPGKRSEERRRI